MYPAYYSIPANELCKSPRIPILVLADHGEVHFELAYEMLTEIENNNKLGRKTVFICPCGPTDQYPIFARLVNERGTSLKNTWIINMDEYLTDDENWIDEANPLSFHNQMNRGLYNRLDPALAMPPEQRVFPDPHNTGAILKLIEELGGVDVVMGGIAINGHIAFNEPQPELSADEFAQLTTRVVTLSTETRIKNAIIERGGAFDTLPNKCITVGMKEILSAKKLRVSMMLDMQRAVVRRAAYGDVTAAFPISLAQRHPDARIIISQNVAELPF